MRLLPRLASAAGLGVATVGLSFAAVTSGPALAAATTGPALAVTTGPDLAVTTGPDPAAPEAPLAASTASSSSGSSPSAKVTLISQPDWVNPGQPFPLRVSIGPTSGSAASDGAELEVSVYQRLVTRSAFALSQSGHELGRALWSNTTALGGGTTGVESDICIPVDAAPGPTCVAPYSLRTDDTPGVYPVVVTVRDADTSEAEGRLVTHLLLLAPGAASNPLQVALVVPEAAPSPLTTSGTRRVAPDDATRLGLLASVLDQKGPDSLTVAPDPGTLAALADTPTPTAHSALAAVRRLSDDAQTLPQTFAPTNPYDLVDASLDGELAAQLARGSDVDSVELGSRPSPATWMLQGPLDRPTVAALAGLGVTRLLLPAGDIGGGEARLTSARPFPLNSAGAGLMALSGDAALAHDLQLPDSLLATHELLADLAQVYFENPNLEYYEGGHLVPEPRVVVAVSPRYWAPSRTALTDLVQTLTTGPFLSSVTLDQAFAQVPPSTTSASSAGPAGHRDNMAGAKVRSLRAALASFSASLVRPVNSTLAIGDLALTSESASLTLAQRNAYLNAAHSRLRAELGQVTVAATGITLTSRQGKVPLSIVSNLPVPVRVTVTLTSTGLQFQGGSNDSISHSFTLRLRNTTWLVPVVARRTGHFEMEVKVVTAEGAQPMSAAGIFINSRAFSGVGIVLSAAALAGLAFWWGRALQKGARNRRLVERNE